MDNTKRSEALSIVSDLPLSKFGLGSDNSDLIVLVIKYFRIVGLVFFVWLFGYLGFSLAWVLLASFAYLWRERTHSARTIKSEMIRAIQLDEKNAILARLDEVPSWVNFPDKERAEWVNNIIKQAWPYFTKYINNVFKETVEPLIQSSLQDTVGKVRFDRIDFGEIPPKIGSIKVYSGLYDEIMMDMEILYAGDARVKLEVKKLISGVKKIQFQGELRMILKPLCYQIPFFAAITAYFLRPPTIDFDLTEAANVLDIPLISDFLRLTISDIFNKFLVLPNRYVIPIVPDFNLSDAAELKAPNPKGVLRLHVIRGQNLKAADFGFMQSGKSDPYVKISGVGNREYTTKVINSCLNPEWNETFDLLVEDLVGNSTLNMSVYDKDLKNDDFLGGLTMDIQKVIEKGTEEGTYKLKNVDQGHIQLKLEWFYLTSNVIQIKQIHELTRQKSLPVAILIVLLKGASGLPDIFKKSGGLTQPSTCATITVDDQTYSSAIVPSKSNPQWDENFIFKLEDPEHQHLSLIVNEKNTKKELCSFNFKIERILKEKSLIVSREFNLKSFDQNCEPKVSMKLTLKLYSREPNSSSSLSENLNSSNAMQTKSTVHKDSLKQTSVTEKREFNRNDSEKIVPFQQPPKLSLTKQHSSDVPNLKSDGTSSPDPYVRLFIQSNNSNNSNKSKQRTKALKDTLNPNYDDTFEWNIAFDDLKRSKLQCSVKNNKPLFSRESVYMGEVLIGLENTVVNNPRVAW